MSDLSNNIQISYLYRDSGNYKLFGEVIFSNPENISMEFIETSIQSILIEGLYFIAEKWNLPKLEFEVFNKQMDHPWHEFEMVEHTAYEPTDSRSITEFVTEIIKIQPGV